MDWTSIPGWFDWPTYYEEVVNSYPGGTLVEVGCYLGRSLCYLGDLVRRSGKPFTVIGVDHALGSGTENGTDHHRDAVTRGGKSFAGELWNNVVACGLQDVVTVILSESGRASRLFLDNSLTLVFLDGRHDYESVARDVALWGPKIELKGQLAGDDFGVPGEVEPVWPGVSRAVMETLPGWRHVPHDAWAWTKK